MNDFQNSFLSRKRLLYKNILSSLTKRSRTKFSVAALKRLEEEGYHLKRPLADSMGGKTGLYELRPGRHRILYSFHERKRIVLLHVFLKKTDDIPQKDIELALVRKEMCEVWFKHGMISTEKDK